MHNVSPGQPDLQRVPARKGVALQLRLSQTLKIINTSGHQVVDTWAFKADDLEEHLSMEHSRVSLPKLVPAVGDTLVSNRRRPMLSFVEDTTSGAHDMLMAACDARRYELLGAVGYHDNCADNLRHALRALGLSGRSTPSPLNLFMNVPWQPDGSLAFEKPTSKPGQYVSLRAAMDLTVVLSACPQDMTPINNRLSADVHFVIY